MITKLAVIAIAILTTLANAIADDFDDPARTLTYEQMARRPNEYQSTPVCLSGSVVQVREPAGDNQVMLRINITKHGKSYDSGTILALYKRNLPDDPVVLRSLYWTIRLRFHVR